MVDSHVPHQTHQESNDHVADDHDEHDLRPTECRNHEAADEQGNHGYVQAGIHDEQISPTLGPFGFRNGVNAVMLDSEKSIAVTLVHELFPGGLTI
jgi:hypothetical protein